MLPFRKILFPVDYSEPCQAVVPYVKDIVRHFPAEITLVHAYGPAAVAALEYNELALISPNLPNQVQSIEEKRLRDFAAQMFPEEHVELIAELGEPGSVIHKIARHQGTDLVMLATRGHGPVRRFLLGSVTAKVLHDVSAVVWTGAGSALSEHPATVPYSSILCALGGDDEAEAVLRAAAALACTYQAQLFLLHVVETPAPSPEIDFGPFNKALVEAAHIRLRELEAKLGISAPYTIFDTTVSDAVREEVLRRKADLVVTGRGHAQARFSRLWSHLYPIVRESPCPVLSI